MMPHHKAVGNPFVAHGAVLFSIVDSKAFTLDLVAEIRRSGTMRRLGRFVGFDQGS